MKKYFIYQILMTILGVGVTVGFWTLWFNVLHFGMLELLVLNLILIPISTYYSYRKMKKMGIWDI